MASATGGLGGVFAELISPTRRPEVPQAPNVNPQTAQLASIQGNLAALSPLEQLASGVNMFNQQQRGQAVNQAIPGFAGLNSAASSDIQNMLNGVLPPDVSNAVSRNANAQAFAGGYGGSPAANNLQARDLGLTSLNLQQQGLNALPGYLGSTANLLIPQQYNIASDFVTPQQQIAAQQYNENNRYGQQWLQNQINALPDPLMAAVGNFVGGLTNDIVGAAETYFSGGLVSGIGTGGGGSAGTSSAFNLLGNGFGQQQSPNGFNTNQSMLNSFFGG